MALLFDEDYAFLKENSIEYEEDEAQRFLIFRNFPLPVGVYKHGADLQSSVDVLYVVPQNYNTSGGDMFWVHPHLVLADGSLIPRVNDAGPKKDARLHNGVGYGRWSRHWNNKPWKPKIDNVRTIVDRITWAFAHPHAKRT